MKEQYEYSHESIVEGLREITEANFKQAIRLCQQDTITLMDQIEYQNKSAKEDHDNIKKLEFELQRERELRKELVEAVEKLLRVDSFRGGFPYTTKVFESVIQKSKAK